MLWALDEGPPAPDVASGTRGPLRCWQCGQFVFASRLDLAQRLAGPEAKPLCRDHHGEAAAEMTVAGMLGHGA